jgi:hypothetical protein
LAYLFGRPQWSIWVTVEHVPALIAERAKLEKREGNLNGTKILRSGADGLQLRWAQFCSVRAAPLKRNRPLHSAA